MKIEEMIEKLRYKANNIKAHIEPEFFNEVADRLEKQVAKKIERYGSNIIGEMTFNCPSCNLEYYVTDYEDFNYCPNCGQKMDWSEADD